MAEPTSGTTYRLDYESWEVFKEAVKLDNLKRGDRLTIEINPDSQFDAQFMNFVAGQVQVVVFGSRSMRLQGLIDPDSMTITVR